jgi:HSP20 family protein
MNIVRWNPAFDLLNVHSEMDRVFNELINGGAFNPRYNGSGSAPAFLPIDIRRAEQGVVIEASVPGFSPDEVTVTVDGGVLTISAAHTEAEDQQEGDFLRRERYVGQLYRQVALGDQVDGDRAEAVFDHGVLTVTVPLVAKPEPRRIAVKGTHDAARGSVSVQKKA